jgi:flagellar biosynthesis protein FlhF
MQVKKFEAPTIQEALDQVKKELGPEAIILQTRKIKGGFGLLSKASFEVTAAVSDRSLQKKQVTEKRFKEPDKDLIQKIPADKQADIYDKYMEKQLEKVQKTQERVELSSPKGKKSNSTTRYVDIPDDDVQPQVTRKSPPAAQAPVVQSFAANQGPTLSQSPSYNASPAPMVSGGMIVEDEIRALKKLVNELKAAQTARESSEVPEELLKDAAGAQSLMNQSPLDHPALQDAFDQLIMNGVERRYALLLIKKVAFELGPDRSKNIEYVMDVLASEIMNAIEVVSPLDGIRPRQGAAGGVPTIIALVGPTGVGKTMTIAKLASHAILRRNLKVGLINLDSYKVNAFDQLATYAKILNLPFRSAATNDDLVAALMDLQNFDVVMVDTIGCSQRDPESIREIQSMLASINDPKTYLVLSGTTRDVEMYDACSRFSVFRPQGAFVTKLDEASIYGSIFNLSQKIKLPLAGFTTGQKIPDDIEEATPERVASLIMDL